MKLRELPPRARRFYLRVHALTALLHGFVAVALGAWLPWWAAVGLAAALGWLTAWRIGHIGHDQPRSRWATRLLDYPALLHWSAALLGAGFWLPLAAAAQLWAPAPSGGALIAGVGAGAAPLAAAAAWGLGLGLAGWGSLVTRRWVRVVRLDVPVPGLAPAFDGFSILHLTDLHLGSFDPEPVVERWVARGNALGADLVAVTGDLVTSGTEFYEPVARALGGLRAPAGVLVTLGNHDQWAPERLVAALQARGLTVLHNRSLVVRRGDATLALAGVDDPVTGKDDLGAALRDLPAGAPVVLLAHDPAVFSREALRGVALTLAGHTHGGQVAVPFLARWFSLATLTGQHRHGLHGSPGNWLHVGAGLGTTGPPVRLGVRPELTLLRLRRSAPEGAQAPDLS